MLINRKKFGKVSSPLRRIKNARKFAFSLYSPFRNFSFHLWSKAFYVDEWVIGYAKTPVFTFISDPTTVEFVWIESTRGLNYVADPFLVQTDQLNIYCEYFDYYKGVGEIVELSEKTNFSIEYRTRVLGDGTHFSYPFVWFDENQLVMIPENHDSNKITAYEFLGPDKKITWAQHDIIVGGQFLDPTLLFHDGLYWCFAAKNEACPEQNLYLFFSEHLYGPYQPHPKNPIKSDIASARPAGRPIKINGRILRPSQDNSRTYGGSLKINEIKELSRESYSEETILEIRGEMVGGYQDGCHHLDHTDEFIAIDTKRRRFHPLAWWFRTKKGLLRRG